MTLPTIHTGTTASSNAATSLAVDKPTGAGAGSAVVITIVFSANHGGLTVPTDFVPVDAAVNRWSGYKILDGSEGATFGFSWVTSRPVVIVCSALSYAGPAALADAQWQSNATTTSHPTPTVLADRGDSGLIGHFTALAPAAANTWTTADLTEQSDIQANVTGPTAMAAVGTQAAIGGTGAKTATSTVTLNGRSYLYAFRAAGAPVPVIGHTHRRRRVA